MADLNKNININVNTTGIDNATKSIDNLTAKTVQLAKGVSIKYDIDNKPIDVVTDSSQRLNRQISALVNAMAVLTQAGKQNSAEFTILQQRHLQLVTVQEKAKGASKDLFGTLALLPGPVGEFSAKVQGALDVFKVFSGLKLDGLINQWKLLNEELEKAVFGEAAATEAGATSGVANVGGTVGSAVKGGTAVAATAEATAVSASATAQAADTTTTSANTVAQGANATARNTDTAAIIEQNIVLSEAYIRNKEEYISLIQNTQGVDENIKANMLRSATTEKNVALQELASLKERKLAIATEETTVAVEASEIALKGLKAVLTDLGILAVLVLLAEGIKLFYDWATRANNAEDATKRFNDELERSQKLLQIDLDTNKRSSSEKIAALKQNNAEQSKIREEELNLIKNNLVNIQNARADNELKIQEIQKRRDEKSVEDLKKANDFSLKLDQDFVTTKTELRNKQSDNELAKNKESSDKTIQLLDALMKKNLEERIIDTVNLEDNLKKKAAIEAYWGHYSVGKRMEVANEIAKQVAQANATNQEREIQGTIDTLQSQLITYKEHSTKDFAIRRQIAEEEYKKDMAAASVALGNRTNLEKEALNKRNQNLKNLTKEKQDFDEAFIKMENDIYTNAIKDNIDKEQTAREEKYREDRKALEKELDLVQVSEETKNDLRKELEEAFNNDIDKIQASRDKREANRRAEHLEVMSAIHKASNTGFFKYYQDQQDLLKAQQDAELANTELTEQEKADIKLKYAQKSKDLQKDEIKELVGFGTTILGAAGSIFDQMSQVNQMAEQNELSHAQGNAEQQDQIKRKYFEKNKQAQIGSTIISTLEASVNAYESLAPIPFVGPVLGAAAAAAALVFGYEKVALIKSTQYESSNTAATQTRLKNYGDGGVIEGPSHASSQGGVKVNAEGGEAIMNKNSVTMFKPLLSMMNQMGGGTSFQKGAAGMAGYDSPKQANQAPQDQPIFKTYVVEHELTTMQARQARMKEISTL